MTFNEIKQHLENHVPLFDSTEYRLFIPDNDEPGSLTEYDLSAIGERLMPHLLDKYHKDVITSENPMIEWVKENCNNQDLGIMKNVHLTNGQSYVDTLLKTYNTDNPEQVLSHLAFETQYLELAYITAAQQIAFDKVSFKALFTGVADKTAYENLMSDKYPENELKAYIRFKKYDSDISVSLNNLSLVPNGDGTISVTGEIANVSELEYNDIGAVEYDSEATPYIMNRLDYQNLSIHIGDICICHKAADITFSNEYGKLKVNQQGNFLDKYTLEVNYGSIKDGEYKTYRGFAKEMVIESPDKARDVAMNLTLPPFIDFAQVRLYKAGDGWMSKEEYLVQNDAVFDLKNQSYIHGQEELSSKPIKIIAQKSKLSMDDIDLAATYYNNFRLGDHYQYDNNPERNVIEKMIVAGFNDSQICLIGDKMDAAFGGKSKWATVLIKSGEFKDFHKKFEAFSKRWSK